MALTKRSAFVAAVAGVAFLLLLVLLRHSTSSNPDHGADAWRANAAVPAEKDTDSVVPPSNRGVPDVPNPDTQVALKTSGVKIHNFGNGRIAVWDSRYSWTAEQLGGMAADQLETLYENAVLETTADCSTARRFGRKDDGGWDLCLVGPFSPQEPCFSFSFGVNNIWEFDDEVASAFKCQVLTFDPSMSQGSHARSNKVSFLKEGLSGSKGSINAWSVDSFMGFLRRFKAQNFVIDILKMDVEGSEWSALETAVKDGSLKNVKQLMLETHIKPAATVAEYQRYFTVITALHELGFRQWHHNWNEFGNFNSKLKTGVVRSCCHELYYVNINFLTGGLNARNPAGSVIASPLGAGLQITKTGDYEKADTLLAMDVASMPSDNLENTYFGILEQNHIACPYSVRVGDSDDGGWDVCMSSSFGIQSGSGCVAFSFGINNVWNYDDQLAEKFGCKVYMFDPSMTTNDHQRKKSSWFYRTGLSSENKVESNGWKMRTLCTLFTELGYSNKTVDILKIDIEHWEWAAFEKAMAEGCLVRVKQLLFETHTSELVRQKSDYGRFIRIWQGLFRLGFRTWKWHKNPQSLFYRSQIPPYAQKACCYEHYMLNLNFANS